MEQKAQVRIGVNVFLLRNNKILLGKGSEKRDTEHLVPTRRTF